MVFQNTLLHEWLALFQARTTDDLLFNLLIYVLPGGLLPFGLGMVLAYLKENRVFWCHLLAALLLYLAGEAVYRQASCSVSVLLPVLSIPALHYFAGLFLYRFGHWLYRRFQGSPV